MTKRRKILLAVGAVVVILVAIPKGGDTESLTEETTTTTTTTTTTAVVSTTAVPETTTTTQKISDSDLREAAFQIGVTEIGTNYFYDADDLLDLGYQVCDIMKTTVDSGGSREDFILVLSLSFEDPLLLEDGVVIAGAAAGSLCNELYEWSQE